MSKPGADQAGTSYPPATPSSAACPAAPKRVVTWSVVDPLTDSSYSRWRRERYAWLYEDEDIWASL